MIRELYQTLEGQEGQALLFAREAWSESFVNESFNMQRGGLHVVHLLGGQSKVS